MSVFIITLPFITISDLWTVSIISIITTFYQFIMQMKAGDYYHISVLFYLLCMKTY